MSRQDRIRSKLATKIFSTTTGIGKSVTLKRVSSTTYDNRGDIASESTTSSTISIVPYDQITERSHETFGELKAGEVEAAVPYDVTVTIGDTITMEGDDWHINMVSPNWLPGNVVTIIRMSKNTA